MTAFVQTLATELKLRPAQAAEAIALLREGASVPFIARYRKERTGNLSVEVLAAIQERLQGEVELEARRAVILNSIHALDKLDEPLREKIQAVGTRAELEDLYLPFSPRAKRSRASVARGKGLEPLADLIYQQATTSGGVEALTMPFLSAEKGVKELADALSGARDIVAERMAEDPELRRAVRNALATAGKLSVAARGKVDLAKTKFSGIAHYSEPLAKLTPRRILTALRGEADKKLALRIEAPRESLREALVNRLAPRPESIFAAEFVLAIDDALDRLLLPALQAEALHTVKALAEASACELLERHLRAWLLQPPMGPKRVLAITIQPPAKRQAPDAEVKADARKDAGAEASGGSPAVSADGDAPGPSESGLLDAPPAPPALSSSGWVLQLAAIDPAGAPLVHTQIAALGNETARQEAREKLAALLREHGIEAIAIGNGAGGREAEKWVREVLVSAEFAACACLLVGEAGLAALATSQAARQELPALDPAVRGTVYLGRRLQDPLAEWVRVDLKTLGGSLFRHEIDPRVLRRKVEETIASCVAAVGVDANSAGVTLLAHVPGVGPDLAHALASARLAQGGFRSREDLKAIPGIDAKVFERVAGFLRIRDGAQPLDRTAIHPERYGVVEKMAAFLGVELPALVGHPELVAKLDPAAFQSEETGLETLRDIVLELQTPGRDPRGIFVAPKFNPDVREVKDLREGQILNGVVTHFATFGVFIDVGVGQDGLVHISELSRRFVRDPAEVVGLGQALQVKVLSVDPANKRFSLSVKALEPVPVQERVRRPTSPRRSASAPAPTASGSAASPAIQTGIPAGGKPGAPSDPRRRFGAARSGRGLPAGRRPAAARTGAPGAPGAAGAAGVGAPVGTAVAGATAPATGGRPAGPSARGGRGAPRGGRGDRVPAGKSGPKLSSSGKPLPDYSKFFVKGKRKDDKKKSAPRELGASRQEVREIMRAQEKASPTLGDLLKKAGVKPAEE